MYYDQRGRGRSYAGHTAGDVDIDSEMEDLDRMAILQDSGHFSFIDQPEGVHRLITEFLAST